MTKKNEKKPKKAVKAASKKVSKKTVLKKAKKAVIKLKKAKAAKPKPKKALTNAKPSKKAANQPRKKQIVKNQQVKKVAVKSTKNVIPPQKVEKQKAEKALLPPPDVQRPKGSPFKLSMALEEKETQTTVVKPRITRSKSGNLLFQLEYTIRSSPTILYEFLTTPSGMAQWFADSVDIEGHHCTFVWDGYPEYATIIDSIPDEYIRYRWENSDEDEYFEFRISKNEITGDTILTITDFASEADMKDQKLLWDSQIKTLVQQVGG